MNNLFEQLKSLGVELGKDKTAYKSKTAADPALILGGTWQENPYGKTLHIHKEYAPGATCGNIMLQYQCDTPLLLDLLHLPLSPQQKEGFNQRSLCFFDTETSSLNLGSGAFAFLCGFSYFNEAGGVCVDQFFMPHPSEEQAFIHAVQSFLLPFKVLSSYNGKAFDVPMLRNRFLLHSMEDDSLEKPHLDLLFVARSLWKRRLASCRLADVEQRILSLEREEEEFPGYLVPLLYQDYLREGDPTPLKGVLYHNEQDVVSLAALYILLSDIFMREKMDLDHPQDLASLAYFHQKTGNVEEAARYFDAYMTQCGQDADPQVLYDYAWLHRRKENWAQALKLWSQAAEMDHLASIIEIAKYYEHQQKDPAQAMQWLARLEEREKDQVELIKDDLEKRSARLSSKMEKNDEN